MTQYAIDPAQLTDLSDFTLRHVTATISLDDDAGTPAIALADQADGFHSYDPVPEETTFLLDDFQFSEDGSGWIE